MSFGDPNNPYGQQQGGQPGYGYPQQGQPQAQPSFGYPQAPPVQSFGSGYGGSYGGPPTTMPGGVKAARVMLYVIGGFQIIGAVLLFWAGVAIDELKDDPELRNDQAFQDLAQYSDSFVGVGVLALLWGVLAIFLAAKLANGGSAIRITTMVFAVITAILGVYPFIVIIVGLIYTVLAVLIAVFVGKSDGGAWFNRPRH
ncbi:hypothetical protein [Streptomyces albipurpureus]|uniref:Integral membrane protein n=1 Tax=Streptomyces albipurpureus TaxID=2897419 RepID=A0ABT0ULS8_9ACTN|nr:hypothetical protein [Streptomyces sp. CWNU-1]MCM2389384.1 hypothetical protein [Streptomyces sp. CWNU-1]